MANEQIDATLPPKVRIDTTPLQPIVSGEMASPRRSAYDHHRTVYYAQRTLVLLVLCGIVRSVCVL